MVHSQGGIYHFWSGIYHDATFQMQWRLSAGFAGPTAAGAVLGSSSRARRRHGHGDSESRVVIQLELEPWLDHDSTWLLKLPAIQPEWHRDCGQARPAPAGPAWATRAPAAPSVVEPCALPWRDYLSRRLETVSVDCFFLQYYSILPIFLLHVLHIGKSILPNITVRRQAKYNIT